MIAVGADGCRGGWLAARVESGRVRRLHVFPHFDGLWSAWGDADLVLVDIPIGLRDEGAERACDLLARQALGHPRGASVYPTPVRTALDEPTFEAAAAANEAATGRRLSLQTWSLVPKIREVDALLRSVPEARARVRESHPEVCLWAYAGRPMTLPKTTQDGYEERLEVVHGVLPAAPEIARRALEAFPRRAVRRDDILDVLLLATAAAGGAGRLRTFPDPPETDAHGLPMAIAYPPPAEPAAP